MGDITMVDLGIAIAVAISAVLCAGVAWLAWKTPSRYDTIMRNAATDFEMRKLASERKRLQALAEEKAARKQRAAEAIRTSMSDRTRTLRGQCRRAK